MSGDQFQLAMIVGSVREGRFGPTVANWFADQAERRDDVKVDIIDLADTPYQGADLTARIGAADAFVVVTPEYNHSFPGPLKAAIDSVHAEWRGKPVGFVSYGGLSGGLRAVEQLRLVFAELRTTTIRETVSFPMARARFDGNGSPTDPAAVDAAAETLLQELAWWAHALRRARAARPYAA